MPIELVMPKLGLNMEEGLLIEWLKREGDPVKKNDPLFVVETEKVTNEYVATTDGILAKILVQGGTTVPVRTVVGYMIAEGESLPVVGSSLIESAAQAAPEPAAALPEPVPTRGASDRILATPIAKRIAKENNIDLATVKGTGPDGRISQEDVERAIKARADVAQKPAPSAQIPAPGDLIPIGGIRAIISDRMFKSVSTTAQVTLHTEVDASHLVAWRARVKKEGETSGTSAPGINAILVYLVAKALRSHPLLNSKQSGNAIQLISTINLGVAVDSEHGLVVIVVKDADKKSIGEIDAEINAMAEHVVQHKSPMEDLTGSTFTITNLGRFGVDFFTPIINPPEMAILGVGRIQEKLVVKDGKVTQCHMMGLSLTFDHRLVDGAPAARFLQTVSAKIEEFGK
jgi:pyruvate dehydrogenase E2 component (dihydrolipoamide acetyltransferase)